VESDFKTVKTQLPDSTRVAPRIVSSPSLFIKIIRDGELFYLENKKRGG